ncbi:lytic transglycosylase domain-containing protein, partial [Enterococcus faecium]
SRYLFHVVQELEKRGMPTELALLPFIESAFNPEALSTAKAAGMWQFIPSTGRDYNLKQNMFTDERRDVLASTDAALTYLQKLYGMFGDWQL